ncbi:YraN family protein [Phosphitispora fastidiosa]|uniref:YraN family protein n=1 Tax=Phosphitispora fastidiosa TaxID=2837202 RepID=UPI001E3DCC80|nr:YraN family protein [Phosphitispora fastidiosa]MBU7005438.1 putative endonuclease [Phosphitispora fastidiosa]
MEGLNKKEIGAIGEDIAANALIEHGYKILERNFRCRYGEIDIIAGFGDTVVFVEVKTRRNGRYGFPEEAVDYRKQKKLRLLAEYYLAKNRNLPRILRFDVYAIRLDETNRPESVRVLENCF